jgi:hypothetical protein
VPCVTPNENSRLGIRTWVAASVRTASHFWKQPRSPWWLQNAVTLPTRSFSAILKEKGLLLHSEYSVTRLKRLNLTDSQQCDAVTYEPGLIVEFHRIAKGAVGSGVKEKRFKSGEQCEVLRREEGAVIVGKDGVDKQLPLD